MSVLLPNAQLTVKVLTHPWVRDAHGTPVPASAATAETRGPTPGAVKEQPDASWTMRLDPSLWPLRAGDIVSDETGRTWILFGDPKLNAVPGYPQADYIAATASLDPPRVP